MASGYKTLIILTVVFLVITPLHAYQDNEAEKNLVMMSVVVWNRSGHTKGLTREMFTILDEKVVRPIEYFDDNDAPVSVGILIDNSGSIEPDKQKLISEELRTLLAGGHPDNEYFLMSFSKTSKLLADWSTANDFLARKFDIERPSQNTAFYDTVFAALGKLHNRKLPRRVLLLISDGQDNSSQRTFKELRNALRDADVTVYVVGILGPSDVGSSLGLEGQSILDELSEITGGGASYPASRKELRTAFSTIANELHHHYRLGFRPDRNDAQNKWRRLKIKVNVPPNAPPEFKNLSIRARTGYYTR